MRFDTTTKTPENTALSETGGAESGALVPTDPDLHHVIAAWPNLPEPIRQAVLAVVSTATE